MSVQLFSSLNLTPPGYVYSLAGVSQPQQRTPLPPPHLAVTLAKPSTNPALYFAGGFKRTTPPPAPIDELTTLFQQTRQQLAATQNYQEAWDIVDRVLFGGKGQSEFQQLFEPWRVQFEAYESASGFTKRVAHDLGNGLRYDSKYRLRQQGETRKELVAHANSVMDGILSKFKAHLLFYEAGVRGENYPIQNVVKLALEPFTQHIGKPVIEKDSTQTYSKDRYGFIMKDVLMYFVIQNVVQNAVKYGQGNDIEVKLSIDPSPPYQPDVPDWMQAMGDAPPLLHVVVTDGGLGIPEGEVDKVLSGSRGSNVGDIAGTGFGLKEIKEMLDEHYDDGAAIKVESPVYSAAEQSKRQCGPGTRVTLSLPLIKK